MPMSLDELLSLREWLERDGWSVECDQIDSYLAGDGFEL